MTDNFFDSKRLYRFNYRITPYYLPALELTGSNIIYLTFPPFLFLC